MPKKNPMLAKLEAQIETKYAILFQRKMDILLQMGQDAANFAAHDTLGMGPAEPLRSMSPIGSTTTASPA